MLIKSAVCGLHTPSSANFSHHGRVSRHAYSTLVYCSIPHRIASCTARLVYSSVELHAIQHAQLTYCHFDFGNHHSVYEKLTSAAFADLIPVWKSQTDSI